MTPLRIVAGVAALLTALVVQAALVAPVCLPVAVSLPAVLVAAVALSDGPGSGMTFGFAAGLVADLGSRHPAGVLALAWMLVGVAAGCLARGVVQRSLRTDAAIAAAVCGLAGGGTGVVLTLLRADGASVAASISGVVPATLADAVLALAVLALVRRLLAADALRPRAALTELVVGAGRG